MAQKQPSIYESYLFTEQEAKEAQRLPVLTRMFIQNLLHNAFAKRVSIEVDPLNIMSFVQQEAALKAEILVLTYLLDCDDTVNKVQSDVQM